MADIDATNEQGKKRTRKSGRTLDSLESSVLRKIIEDKFMKNQLRVLCIDDETCEMLSATPGVSNIEVKSTGNFAEALRLVQTEPFDLYLLETRLPDGDGFELCRLIHKFAPRKPIIFIPARLTHLTGKKV